MPRLWSDADERKGLIQLQEGSRRGLEIGSHSTPVDAESTRELIHKGDQTVATKRSRKRKYSRGTSKDVEGAMRRRKRGTLRSGKGGKVKSRKQAIAIGLSEARKKGKKVPRKRRGRQ